MAYKEKCVVAQNNVTLGAPSPLSDSDAFTVSCSTPGTDDANYRSVINH